MQKFTSDAPVSGDQWISSVCNMCYCGCSIKGHVVNGVLVKIEGNPDSSIGSGRLCPKGVAGIMMVYDPNRVNKPLKRTNPEKGLGVDPKWVEISWDEALDTIVKKLKEVHDTEPKQLFTQGTTTTVLGPIGWMMGFGSDTSWAAGGGLHCGNGAHQLGGVMHASWSLVPDFKRCNYAMYFGCSKGHSAGHVANQNAQDAADARARGMHLVVVDPMCNYAAGKANEWVPIRPGTDAALALAMANQLVNVLGMYDAKYLQKHTNGPYLIRPDGHYLRDKATNKPQIWDVRAGKATTFDDPAVKEYALEGDFVVDGVKVQPAFQILKEHLKKYTPEYASEISSIPAANIRRLAREFGEAARIGSTITIEGKEYPYRPAAAIYFRGSQGHKNSAYNCLSIDLLNQLVGSADLPGGCLGFNPACNGFPQTGKLSYLPYPCPDGLMITGSWMSGHKPYPASTVSKPKSAPLREAFPWAMFNSILGSPEQEEWWTKWKLPFRPKVMMNYGANAIMSVGNKDQMAEALLKYDFIVSFDIYLNEQTDLADIVLPDTTYMERLECRPNWPFIFNHPAGEGDWSWPIRQPMVKPIGERRDYSRVTYEIMDRLGLREVANRSFNAAMNLEDKYALEPDKKYTLEEVWDRMLKQLFGDEHGLEWFQNNGVMRWPKKAEEVYWRTRAKVRVPIYFEMFQTTGEQLRALAQEYGIENDLEYWAYNPVPDWHPCPSHEVEDSQYDLWSFYFRDTLHTNSLTMENPWLDEASAQNPYTYTITLNADIGKKKGLRDGDVVWLESNYGRKVQGKLRLSEGIHPQSVGMAACAGHWSKSQPIAKGKGVFYNELIEIDYKHSDPNNLCMDLCAKVKVYKA